MQLADMQLTDAQILPLDEINEPMVVIVNGELVELSDLMKASEFFKARERFGTRSRTVITAYAEQFLVLNSTATQRYHLFKNMRLTPFIEVFRAIEFYGCVDKLIISAKRSLNLLFNTYTIDQMLYLADFLYEPVTHHEYIHISDMHCGNMRCRIINMTTIDELNAVYDFVLDISDEDLHIDWENAAIRLSTDVVVVSVEAEINQYLNRYPGAEHLAIDWTHLATSGLSQQFIAEHAHYARARAELIIQPEYQANAHNVFPLQLYNLPIRQQAVAYARASIGTPEFWESRQINDRTSFQISNVMIIHGNGQWTRDNHIQHTVFRQ